MKPDETLKLYAMYYVSENDDFDTKKKLDMLNFIEQADEMMLMDLFENGEIENPESLFTEDVVEKDDATVIGESVLMVAETDAMLEGENLLEVDLKNRLKDMLGMETDLKYKISKAAGSAKDALEKQLANVQDKIGDLRSAISKGAEKAVKGAKEAGEKAGEMAAGAGEAVKKGAEKAVKAGGEALEKGKEMAGDAASSAGKAVSKAAEHGKELASQAGEKVAGAAGKAAELAQQHGGMVGAAAGAAAALAAGVMAYRKFWSKAAQACKGAADQDACRKQYKMKAKMAQVSALNSAKAKCAKTKKPDACKAKIDAKIASIKGKMRG